MSDPALKELSRESVEALVERLRTSAKWAARDRHHNDEELANEAADTLTALQARLSEVTGESQRALDHFDLASELYTNDADLAAGMASILRAAIKGTTPAVSERDAIIEECALAAENEKLGEGQMLTGTGIWAVHDGAINDCARAIRALKGQSQ